MTTQHTNIPQSSTRPTLARLRAMMSPNSVFNSQAFTIAEKQALLFLQLSGCTEPTQITGAIEGLPRIKIELTEDLPTSGSSEWANGHWLVQIRSSEPPARQRFTLAHELKHIIDRPHLSNEQYHALSPSQRSHVESVCDYFAGCLLVPRPWLKRAWTSGQQDVDELAKSFGVSRQAMVVRLDQTGLRASAQDLSVRDSLARAFEQRRSRRRFERAGWTTERDHITDSSLVGQRHDLQTVRAA